MSVTRTLNVFSMTGTMSANDYNNVSRSTNKLFSETVTLIEQTAARAKWVKLVITLKTETQVGTDVTYTAMHAASGSAMANTGTSCGVAVTGIGTRTR